jgi:hypothetical protein
MKGYGAGRKEMRKGQIQQGTNANHRLHRGNESLNSGPVSQFTCISQTKKRPEEIEPAASGNVIQWQSLIHSFE